MTVPPPAALGSNEPITGAAKKSVGGLFHSAQTVVRLVRERSANPPGLRNVDYGCFDGQRKLDHTTERFQGGFKAPMETGCKLDHTTERHQRGFNVPMETGSVFELLCYAILTAIIGLMRAPLRNGTVEAKRYFFRLETIVGSPGNKALLESVNTCPRPVRYIRQVVPISDDIIDGVLVVSAKVV